MSMLVQLAFGAVLAAGPAHAGRAPLWDRQPVAPARPVALVAPRLSRRLSTPRVERGAAPLGARPSVVRPQAWTSVGARFAPALSSPHLAAHAQRGPPSRT
jgi:hypothetical protein